MANRVYGYQGYNKGYQFETSPKKLQPEYEPNEENNPTKKEKTKTKTKIEKIPRLGCPNGLHKLPIYTTKW